MNRKSQYKTKQYKEILSYLAMLKGSHLTAKDIFEHFQEHGERIGITTVYRQLERMVNEGAVKKYTIDNNTSSCFEYVGTEDIKDQRYYHCKCEQCGKLIHLECNELSEIKNHVLQCHGFQIDSLRTVIYGLCEECRK